MKWPACGFDNIQGEDNCESCHGDLTAVDGVVPRTKIEKALMEKPLLELHPKEAIMVNEKISIMEAAAKMNETRIGCLLIQDTFEKIVGIVSERDILCRAIGKISDLSKTPITEIMTPNPQTLDEDDTIACVLHEMSINRYRHIPVLREGEKTGIISARDVLNYLAKLIP